MTRSNAFFVTGTDTEVGKTFVSCALLEAANRKKIVTAGFKPIAAGCEKTADGLRNEDALLLQKHSSLALDYDLVNPIALAPPVAPHLAAAQIGQSLTVDDVTAGYLALTKHNPEFLLVEGAGGWRLPLDNDTYLSDFVIQQKLPVILVVGIRLGCLNHAVLTAETIRHDGLKLAGWVANCVDPDMDLSGENIADLQQRLKAPCLGIVPNCESYSRAADCLDIGTLLG